MTFIISNASLAPAAGSRCAHRRRQFGSMFLAQVPHTPGSVPSHDLDRDRRASVPHGPGSDADRAHAFTDDGCALLRAARWTWWWKPPAVPRRLRHARAAIAAAACRHGQCRADVLAAAARREARRPAGLFAATAPAALTAEMVDGRATAFASPPRGKGPNTCRHHDVTPEASGAITADGGRSAIGRHEPANVQFSFWMTPIRDRNAAIAIHRSMSHDVAVFSALLRRRLPH